MSRIFLLAALATATAACSDSPVGPSARPSPAPRPSIVAAEPAQAPVAAADTIRLPARDGTRLLVVREDGLYDERGTRIADALQMASIPLAELRELGERLTQVRATVQAAREKALARRHESLLVVNQSLISARLAYCNDLNAAMALIGFRMEDKMDEIVRDIASRNWGELLIDSRDYRRLDAQFDAYSDALDAEGC